MAGILGTFKAWLRGAGHFVVGPNDPNQANDHIVLKANAGALEAGRLLGKVTATGQYAAHDPALADGTEVAAAILWKAAPTSAAVQRVAAVVRGPTVCNGNALTFKTGITTPQRDAAVAALAAKGLMIRF